MTIPGARRVQDERLDLHNANVDQLVARSGRCGMVELTSGRICILALRHPGPCHFVPGHIAKTQRPVPVVGRPQANEEP